MTVRERDVSFRNEYALRGLMSVRFAVRQSPSAFLRPSSLVADLVDRREDVVCELNARIPLSDPS